MISKYIGNTPIVRLTNIEKHFNISAELYAKLEYKNPSGSVKDRAALYILNAAISEGELSVGGKIVEATSGNMGISLSFLSAALGFSATIVMPENMSCERVKIIRAYGAEVVLTEAEAGMSGAIERAREISSESGDFMPNQFTNLNGAIAHYSTTGPEIYREMLGKVDIFSCGVGTAGTFFGVGRYLKEKKSNIKLLAIEPSESAVISGKTMGKHGIQGIGAGFFPPLLDTSLVDETLLVSTSEALDFMSLLSRKEGIFAGVSSGAALYSLVCLGMRKENKGKRIVTVFPDGGERYLSIIP